MQDPNFPENLNIGPSTCPGTVEKGSNLRRWAPDYDAQQVAIERYGIAGRVWEAAYALLQYAYPPPDCIFDPPFLPPTSNFHCDHAYTMIELGSGVGMVSAAVAGLLNPKSDMIIATDLPEVCPLLHENLRPQKEVERKHIIVKPLSWGNRLHALQLASEFFTNRDCSRRLTHIICSDLVYFPELLAPLLRTLLHLTSSPFHEPTDPSPTVIISYKIRSLAKETPFWSAFGLWFTFRPVLMRRGNGSWERFGARLMEDPTFIFVGHRRPESVCWQVPVGDRDLLSGVGAWGTDATKSDDTFESLLLMSLDDDG